MTALIEALRRDLGASSTSVVASKQTATTNCAQKTQPTSKQSAITNTLLERLRGERLDLDVAERNELKALDLRRTEIAKRHVEARAAADAKIVSLVLKWENK